MNSQPESMAPSFVVFHIGNRRAAVPRECVAELIASPVLFSFPHTTPLITGVALRRGRIIPILDLGPGLLGAPSPAARFFLVVERRISGASEKCAIPVQGECELVSAMTLPAAAQGDYVTGQLDLNGEQVDVLDLEKAIAASARIAEGSFPSAEVLP